MVVVGVNEIISKHCMHKMWTVLVDCCEADNYSRTVFVGAYYRCLDGILL